MENIFYLDGYNLICSNIHEQFLNGNLKLYRNDEEIPFVLKTNDNKIEITFNENYREGDKYVVIHNDEEYDVQPRFIFHSKKFDEDYCPDLKTLGSFFLKSSTAFRLWAPFSDAAYVVIEDEPYRMSYVDKGVYEATIKGNLEKKRYHYLVERSDKSYAFNDLFSYVNTKDNKDSIIIDTKKLKFKNIKTKLVNDPIIYELSIRDFSSDKNAPFINKGKFIALNEEGLKINDVPIGIDYLKELGISHVQFMPITNFDLDGFDYGWGYNPIDYNSLYWGYVKDDDAYAPILELRSVIDKLHSIGLKVNIDVVFNHVYRINDSSFDKTLPYYFFRYNNDGSPANASGCGNELRSESKFLSTYFNLMVERYIKMFDIDGLRFDLAGVINIDTMNAINMTATSLKKDFLMYGEGWNMGSLLDDSNEVLIENASKVTYFGFFNGYYRDNLKGVYYDEKSVGYLTGNKELEDEVKEGLCGSNNLGLNAKQSVNYVECHDNYTFFDKVSFIKDDQNIIKDICKSGLASILLSIGIPFIHAGQEFLRSKSGSNNSYNLSDDINNIDWNRMVNNIDSVNYLKELIALRRKYPYFNGNKETSFSYYYDLLIFTIGDLDIFINPSDYPYIYTNWITYDEVLSPYNKFFDVSSFDIPAHSFVVGHKS